LNNVIKEKEKRERERERGKEKVVYNFFKVKINFQIIFFKFSKYLVS